MSGKEQLPPQQTLPVSLPGTPLCTIPNFPPERARQLASLWVTTAEEFISVASTPRGQAGLSDLLEVSRDELDDLLKMASDYLPEEAAEEFAQQAEKRYPLGAILTDSDDEPPGTDEPR